MFIGLDLGILLLSYALPLFYRDEKVADTIEERNRDWD